MLDSSVGQGKLKPMLKASAAAGLAAVLFSATLPVAIPQALADPVEVEAPAVPGFGDVVAAVSPAVVSVVVESDAEPVAQQDNGFGFGFGGRGFDNLPDDHPLKRFFRDFGAPEQPTPPPQAHKGRPRPVAQGSGFFVSGDGYLVTNNHVVKEGDAFSVLMDDGTEYDAKLVGTDPRTDLAVLKVDADREFTYVKFADDERVRVGDWVVAVGNPFGLGGTVTAGIVSALGRDISSGPYDDYIQIDAAVNHGNSGGPDFNLNGEVVGINTAIFSPSGGNVGIAFAIPAHLAQDVVNDLIQDGSVERGWLGVRIQPVTEDIAESIGLAKPEGAMISEPTSDSPGAKAGLKQGDVITAVNGDVIKDARSLSRTIGMMEPGQDVELSVWRDGKSQTINVKLGEFPNDDQLAAATPGMPQGAPAESALMKRLGIEVAPADDGAGVTVTAVDPDSDAAVKGLAEGQKILSVNNQTVASADDIIKQVDDAAGKGRSQALFQVETDNGSMFTALPTEPDDQG
ncbi:Do family serine endopeptidase [Martelella endophytica]|uniref:Probable periplasmic serine endoprotease DegP-like n=1 Tax=Martelella endophytica TaxID=1486262 RepID=A0A0D5LTX4_MAREN|nr:Do family serine endopeptidase [Martelella endophytica]AJY47217.1 serine peptidase [Martelella endophytica]